MHPIDWAAARDRWNQANVWRALACACRFGAAVALTALPGATDKAG